LAGVLFLDKIEQRFFGIASTHLCKYFPWIVTMKNICLTVCILLSLTSPLHAQKNGGPTGIFNSQQEYYDFMGAAKQASVGDAEMMAMIPMLNDIVLQREFGSTAKQYNAAGSELGLLANRAVREEIEMVDDQFKDLQDRKAELQKRLSEQIRSIDFSNPEQAVVEIRKIRDVAQKDLNGLLLPHQVTRLKQIRMQNLLQKRSLLVVLTSDPIKSDLEISDAQTKKLQEAEKEITKELAEKIAKLQEEAREKLISNLDVPQQTKVKEMIGDAFDLNSLGNKKRWSKGILKKDSKKK
jgi:hypothetical protein